MSVESNRLPVGISNVQQVSVFCDSMDSVSVCRNGSWHLIYPPLEFRQLNDKTIKKENVKTKWKVEVTWKRSDTKLQSVRRNSLVTLKLESTQSPQRANWCCWHSRIHNQLSKAQQPHYTTSQQIAPSWGWSAAGALKSLWWNVTWILRVADKKNNINVGTLCKRPPKYKTFAPRASKPLLKLTSNRKRKRKRWRALKFFVL